MNLFLPNVIFIGVVLISGWAQLVAGTVFSNSLQLCSEQCVDRNLAIPLASGSLHWRAADFVECDYACHIDSCQTGCKDLEQLNSSCDERCGAVKARDSCLQGCYAVSSIFLHQIQYLLNHATVESKFDSLHGTILTWSFGEAYSLTIKEISSASIQWHAQSRMHLTQLKAGAGWKWTEFPPGSFKESVANVEVAIPNEESPEIEVRLAAIWRDKTVVSRTFLHTISGTTPKPKHPLLTTVTQAGPTEVLACWDGDSGSYTVKVWPDGKNEPLTTIKTTASCQLLRGLPGVENGVDPKYKVGVSDADSEEVDSATVEISEPRRDFRISPIIIFTNGTAIMRLTDPNDFLLLGEMPLLGVTLGPTAKITAIAAVNHRNLFIGLSDGTILALKVLSNLRRDPRDVPVGEFESEGNAVPSNSAETTKVVLEASTMPKEMFDDVMNMTDTEETTMDMDTSESTPYPEAPSSITYETEQSLIRGPDGTAIVQLVVDTIQQRVYAVRNQSGLIRCGFRDCANATVLTTNSVAYIERIAVDSWNGYLYYATANGDVFVATLFPTDAPSTYAFSIQRRVAQIPSITTMHVDYTSGKLLAVLKNGTLAGMDLVDQSVIDMRPNLVEGDKFVSVSKFATSSEGQIFWVSNACGDDHGWVSCLYGEELEDNGKRHLNRYLFEGPVLDVAVMEHIMEPAYLLPPQKVSLIVDGSEVRATWAPPGSLPFQAPGHSWRNFQYDYKFTDAASGTVLEHSRTRELSAFIGIKLSPDRNYTLFVEACVMVSFLPDIRKGCSKPGVTTIVAPKELSATPVVVYLDHGPTENPDTLLTTDLLGRSIDADAMNFPKLTRPMSDVLGFDNATKSTYGADGTDISVFRIYPSSIRYRFLDFLTVKHMSILPSKALVVFASAYQVIQYRLTSTFDRVIYQCSHQDCAEVVGLASHDASGTVFYLLQSPNGSVALYEFNTDKLTSNQLSVVNMLPLIKQLVFVNDHFVYLSLDGHIGSIDKSMTSIHENGALTGAMFVLPSVPTVDQSISFIGPITTGAPTLSELYWKLSRPIEEGQVVYKVQFFKDRIGGETTTDLSMTNTYAIAPRVLEAWPSQQRYDAIVDAITPWTVVSVNTTELMAPTKPPSAPRNLKMFVTQQKTVDGARAIIDLFWDEPTEWNGEMLGYSINCTITDGTSKSNTFVQTVSGKDSLTYSFSVKSGKVSCAVAASNEQNLLGKFSDLVTVDSSDVRPLVRLFAIDSTHNLIAISNWSTIWDGVRRKKRESSAQTPSYQGMAFVDNNLYAIRQEDSVQPFAVMLDVNNVENVLHKVQLNTEYSAVDAVTSDWVANRLLFVAGHELFQIVLDTFDSLSVATPQKVFTLSSGAQDAKQLLFDPFSNAAYLLTKNGSLFRLDLTEGSEQNLALSLDCLTSQTVTSMTTDFKWNRAASPTIYALTWNGLIAIDPLNAMCTDIEIEWEKFGEKGLKSVLSVSIADKLFVFGTATELIIYDRTTATPVTVSVQNTPLSQVLAVSQSSQPYPERTCFQLPSPETIQFNVTNEGRSGALLHVMEPTPATSCLNVSFPPTQFDVHFRRVNSDKVKHFRSISNNIHIENGILDKETDYEVSVSWFNRYYTYKDQYSGVKPLRTGYGYPTAPRQAAAYPLSPDTVLLFWRMPFALNAPKEEIQYRILQQSASLAAPASVGARGYENGSFSGLLSDIVACVVDPCRAKIANLRPSVDYRFWITALHVSRLIPTFSEDQEAVSPEAAARTLDVPGTLRLDNVTSDSLLLRWNSLEPATLPQHVEIQYRLSGTDVSWTSDPNASFDPRQDISVNVTIPNLRSSTAYDYRFVASYKGHYAYNETETTYLEQFYQPVQQGRTKAGTPSAPAAVKISKENAYWTLHWSEPENDGGAPIISYAVEYRPNKTAEWEIAERGLPYDRLWWRIDKPSAYSQDSQFRVRAANSEGFGSYGLIQEMEITGETGSTAYYLLIWLGLIFLLLMGVVCFVGVYLVRKNKKTEKMRKFKVNKVIQLDDLNLNHGSLTEMPKPFQNEVRNLPHVSRECVKILEKIGKGSFGEVYSGNAWNLPHIGSKRVQVAIKTLRNTTSHEECMKFVKEAILMNNFDHPNIVKLLGVCFEAEPHWLILELMEGGDLLNFLRQCRPRDTAPSQLSLSEIFSIMIDIGRGCAYLEMNRHVHRDLAARNCLITSTSSPMRVTKIADFGLARQMYINDYYRVKGEDFLPLRWLSIESATDGLFTTKSDVWAYAVLCWEVLTLGEQPYSDRPNSMVLPFIRSGHRLDKPVECPDELFAIISSCWRDDPDTRPSFAEILEQLESLHNKPEMRSNSPFPLIQPGYTNNGFDASHDSSMSQSDSAPMHHPRQHSADLLSGGRFDKSDNPSSRKPSNMTNRLRHRGPSSITGSFNGLDRPESAFSANTEITICDDIGASDEYEIPRSQPTPSSMSLSSSRGGTNPGVSDSGYATNRPDSPGSNGNKKSGARVSRV
uniref:receptor protein-tyrosine kinase n=1 Tax=Panagrellus redivivus TaxID=6233 RepID=A0A7E4UPM6_PANRE